MIRTVIASTASVFALALATPALAESQPADETAAAAAEPTTPTMSFGEWGVDPALISQDVDPGDDFFKYVNQKWLDANPLPAEFSRFGAFNLLREKSTTDVKALIDELVAKDPASLSNDESRIVNAHNAYLDTAAIDAADLAPAQGYINQIVAANTLGDLANLWATPGFSSPIGGFVNVDAKQPDRYVAYIGIGGLGLPDRDYYTDTSEKGLETQKLYKEYLTFLFGEAGYADPAAAAIAVYAFEDRLAREVMWDRTVSRNRDLTYNAVTKEEMAAMAGDVPVNAIMDAIGFSKSPIYVVSSMPPSEERIKELGLDEATVAKIGKGLPGMFDVLSNMDVATLQAWTIKEFLSDNASVLPTRFDKASFEFYGKKLRGTPEQRPRWKRAIDATEGSLGELVGKSYVERYFPAENKAAMDKLVANLRIAMAQSIEEIDWMGAQTKVEAKAKLDSFDPKIGYRDNLETYEGLAITADNPLANSIAAQAWQLQDNIAKLGGPIDRTEWFMTPQTVNAYYNPTKNEIVFPAAILQQPFFGLGADIAVNYGAIGGVIGHEIGHGFDDQGSKSDGTGKLRNWWTDEDRAAFDERGDKLVAQYSSFCPFDDGETCVNGRLTLGENIGDVGGLSLAYRAYKIATKDVDVPVIDGFTGDQRFFLAWAQVWRSAQREENYRLRLRTGAHSPEEYRVNGVVRNIDAWYEAFGVTEGDAMYLPPEERVRIW
ncbi:M13 family metallopeptidase [Parerythrobacter jejuensis]|uniref:M13 family peptidase n=1 Tax=Parerythrobacter jejuensis TaxID=795812 RepID=A0A845AYQ6_9SPHN|nr:M13 family metallopeptidase [Parerythrobacter jejuensis]MXP31131.1 M13 family peptidase [Parerythrobacter jejuensis]MXP33891.1 M13 family peptidase [Parerythrobacter jejuensis]